MMQNPLQGPLGVCLGWALKLSRVEAFLGGKRQLLCQFRRLTPGSLELIWNAGLGHQISGKIWTIIYCWKALDVYFPTQLEAHQLDFCSSWKSIPSAERSESNNISSPSSASESDFCSSPSISTRNYLKSQKNTQNHSKTQKYDFYLKTNKNILKTS